MASKQVSSSLQTSSPFSHIAKAREISSSLRFAYACLIASLISIIQWAGEVISAKEKTTVAEEFRELERDIDLRKNGMQRCLFSFFLWVALFIAFDYLG